MSNGYIPEFLGSNTAGDIVGLATGTGSRSRQATGVATDAALHVGVELAADITVGVFGSQGIPITYKAAVTFAWLPVKLSQTAGGKALLGASKGALAGKMLLDAGVYIGALVDCAQQ